ncbi:MAG: hypothetical protein HUU21_20690 [Polyangiaceae bacterium]|nr:hypothetical protein [Polyangiaceae bacterium]NUQ75965.1 hypothetical protein [Polyangiaceae bacterium]
MNSLKVIVISVLFAVTGCAGFEPTDDAGSEAEVFSREADASKSNVTSVQEALKEAAKEGDDPDAKSVCWDDGEVFCCGSGGTICCIIEGQVYCA